MSKKKTVEKTDENVKVETPEPSVNEEIADTPVEDSAPAGADSVETKSEEQLLKDRMLRLQADFDNFRKRTARDRSEWQAFAIEQFLQDLLPVVDHYELGLAMAEQHGADKAVMDGLRLVYDQLLGAIKKQGVLPLSAEPGTPFNPHEHEAISHVPSEEHPADVIIAETRKGYKQGDKLIRPLQVVVSSGPVETEDAEGAE